MTLWKKSKLFIKKKKKKKKELIWLPSKYLNFQFIF